MILVEIKMANTINTKEKCHRCGKDSQVTDTNMGENFCGKCGFVITDKVEESGPEWRSISNEGENKTQRDISEAVGVTEVTIRNRYKGLKVALNL